MIEEYLIQFKVEVLARVHERMICVLVKSRDDAAHFYQLRARTNDGDDLQHAVTSRFELLLDKVELKQELFGALYIQPIRVMRGIILGRADLSFA